MAANGYIVIAPNRRGLPGFGMEWLEEISGDYNGLCMKDYLSAIDDIATEPYVDRERLGAVGASFGGGRQRNPNAPQRGESIRASVPVSFTAAVPSSRFCWILRALLTRLRMSAEHSLFSVSDSF